MLYTTTDIKTNTLIPSTIEDRFLLSTFEIVERSHILNVLGSELLSELTSQFKTNTISPSNQVLLDELRTLYIVATVYQGLTFWNNRVFKTGVGKQNSAFVENLSKEEEINHSANMLQSVQTLESSMQKWLNENSINYPLYKTKERGNTVRKTGGFYLIDTKCLD
jgi:hypothetical protein